MVGVGNTHVKPSAIKPNILGERFRSPDIQKSRRNVRDQVCGDRWRESLEQVPEPVM